MRTDLQLIQSAVADYDLINIELIDGFRDDIFHVYKVKLNNRFKGIPSNWYFILLPCQGDETGKLLNKNEIIEHGRKLIATAVEYPLTPLVFLSDDIRINVEQEYGNINKPVFLLNKTHLPGKVGAAESIRNIPIILAAKHKLERENYPLYLSPYAPNEPVKGWQFFGRQKELNSIVQSKANCFILAARKMGKTSLIQEVENQLQKVGYKVYHIGVQYLRHFGEVVNALVSKLSVRDAYYAQRDTIHLDTNFILNVIKRLKGENKKILIVFDELGNVMSKDPRNAWNFIGVLRELSHNGEIRVIATAFQEVYIRTYKDPDSPLLNFGNFIRLNQFTKNEVEELLIQPLALWYQIEDKNELLLYTKRNFGFHPLILQYVGRYVFENIFNSSEKKVLNHLQKLRNEDIGEFYQSYVEMYESNHSLLEKYMYILVCSEAENICKELNSIEIKQAKLEEILEGFNINSTLEERNYFLFRLALKGLFFQDDANGLIFRIATPIIFYYIHSKNDIEEMLYDYKKEIFKIVKDIKIDYQNEGS
jgi:AAA-like domain